MTGPSIGSSSLELRLFGEEPSENLGEHPHISAKSIGLLRLVEEILEERTSFELGFEDLSDS